MAGFPKVLTVSYGALTCRLEGFEDSLRAVSAMAEFVRELARREPRAGAPGARAGGRRTMPPPLVGPERVAAEPRAEGGVETEMDEFEASLLGGTAPMGWVEEGGEEAPEGHAMTGTAALWAGAFDEPWGSPPPPQGRRGAWADEAAVSRLMGRADAQLAEPEALRRQEALARLRAAVAATEAARRLGEPQRKDRRREDPFRGDLRHAVEAHDARPGRAAAGPVSLTLVASRPSDAPPSGTDAPDGGPGAHDAGAFAAFADRACVATLADLLEAAAAFTCLVERAEDFSRPQLMARARQAGRAPVTREDELRAFGALLRQGSIVRVRGGRYRVGPGSRFDPARQGPGAGR